MALATSPACDNVLGEEDTRFLEAAQNILEMPRSISIPRGDSGILYPNIVAVAQRCLTATIVYQYSISI